MWNKNPAIMGLKFMLGESGVSWSIVMNYLLPAVVSSCSQPGNLLLALLHVLKQ
jgi:hypothetical protein